MNAITRTVAEVTVAPLELLELLELEPLELLELELLELEPELLELLELELELELPELVSSSLLQALSRLLAAQTLKSVTARCLNRIVPPASVNMSGFLSPRHLNPASLRTRGRLLTGAGTLLLGALAACTGATEQQKAALREGRDAVTPCRERFHDESTTYADCALYVSQQPGRDPQYRPWRQLGALYTGWVSADMVGQQGDAPADDAARRLLHDTLQLQQRLGAREPDLCELVAGASCAALRQRQQALLQPRPSGIAGKP